MLGARWGREGSTWGSAGVRAGRGGCLGALQDLGDGRLHDLKLGVGGAHGDGVFLDGNDGADDAGGGGDAVTGLEVGEEGGLLLGAFLLGPDESTQNTTPMTTIIPIW